MTSVDLCVYELSWTYRITAAAIKKMMGEKKGVSTYKTSWRSYSEWHAERFNEPPVICEMTGLVV